jgi:hypothetical protein
MSDRRHEVAPTSEIPIKMVDIDLGLDNNRSSFGFSLSREPASLAERTPA